MTSSSSLVSIAVETAAVAAAVTTTTTTPTTRPITTSTTPTTATSSVQQQQLLLLPILKSPIQETTSSHYSHYLDSNHIDDPMIMNHVDQYDDDDDDDVYSDAIVPCTNNPNDDDTSNPQTQSQQQPKVRIHRIRMTIFHYWLTYPQWSIALFIYLASMTMIPSTTTTTTTNVVSDTFHKLHSMIQNESYLYTTSIQNEYQYYEQNIHIELQKELQRIQLYRSHTYQPYIMEQTWIYHTNVCTNTSHTALRAIQTWYNTLHQIIPMVLHDDDDDEVGVVNTNTTVTTTPSTLKHDDSDNQCTINDHQTLLLMISNDVNIVQSNIQDIINKYMSESLYSIHTLVQYSYDRTMYDYHYFIGLKIQSTIQLIDQFVFTLSPPTVWNITTTTIQIQFTMEIRKLLQDLLDVIYSSQLHIDILTIRLHDFNTSIHAFYLNYMNLYNRFDSIQNFVLDFLPPGISLPNYFDISDLPLPHSLLPIDFFNTPTTIPNFNINLPNIELLTNTFIDQTLQLLMTILLEITNDITNQVQLTIQQFINELRQQLQLNDYHPPKYPNHHHHDDDDRTTGIPTDEMNYISSLAEMMQSNLTNAFDTLRHYDAYPSDISMTTMDISNNTNNNNNWTMLLMNDSTNINQFLDLVYPTVTNEFDFIPRWIITIIIFLSSQSVMIEFMIQLYRLRQLKRKYEHESTPDLPNIDYIIQQDNNNDDAHETTTWTYRINVLRNIVLQHMMNPWVIVGIVLLPLILILFVFWFPHVKESCIDSRHGTYIARNIWIPLNINHANRPGRIQQNIEQIQCYNRQRYICHTQMMISDSIYRSDMNMLHSLQTRYNESKSIHDIIRKCVDIHMLDTWFQIHCCGLEHYDVPPEDGCRTNQQQYNLCPIDDVQMDPPAAFRPLHETLSDMVCQNHDYPILDAYTIEQAYFNCSSIQQTCEHVPCTGVDENLITLWTIEADCIIEVYIIQICIFIAIVVYHAIMINVMNRLFFHGILQIQWQRLKPDGITLITSLDSDGHLTMGNNQQERAILIQRVMKQYVRTGYLQIGLGGLIFIIWIITTLVIRHFTSHISVYHN